jgi:hypothetical protein
MSPIARVEVYSSYAYSVEPRSFCIAEERHVVEGIKGSWRTPGELHFYVRDENQHLFELIYKEANDRWFLEVHGETCRVASHPTSR